LSLWYGFLLIVFITGGITLKLADFYGERGDNIIQYFFAAIAAFSFGLLISDSPTSSSIILGIIIGVALSKKVNRPNLILGLVFTFLISGILGFSLPIPWLLIIVSIVSFIDELFHDKLATNKEWLRLFFRFRLSLKLVMLFLAILSLVEIIYFLGFLSFDFAYDITGWLLCGEEDIKAVLN